MKWITVALLLAAAPAHAVTTWCTTPEELSSPLCRVEPMTSYEYLEANYITSRSAHGDWNRVFQALGAGIAGFSTMRALELYQTGADGLPTREQIMRGAQIVSGKPLSTPTEELHLALPAMHTPRLGLASPSLGQVGGLRLRLDLPE